MYIYSYLLLVYGLLPPSENLSAVNNNNNNNNNRGNEKGTCMLIDVVISGDRNVIKKRSREDSKI